MKIEPKSSRTFPLTQIYFYLTKGCNLRCRHCWIQPEFEEGASRYPALDIASFRQCIEEALPLGLKGVKLTGGEPFLHPKIFDILEHIREKKLSLTVETNAVLCTAEIVQAIIACKNPFVAVSLDGPDAQIHEWVRQVKGSFEGALRGIRMLVGAGLRPQMIMSVMRHNKDEECLRAAVKLAESIGAGSVKFNFVMPMARGEMLAMDGGTIPASEVLPLGAWIENELAKESSISLMTNLPVAFRSLRKMYGAYGIGCHRCTVFNIIGVLGDGSYALCGIGATVPELIFGRVGEDRLADIWEQSPVLNHLRAHLPQDLEGVCRRCIMKYLCLGTCVALNYYREKKLLAANWVCQEAYDSGSFPGSRLNNPAAFTAMH
jgi:SynChlorMet cassette radical SAM/SPASM protein ScmF